MHMPVLYAKRLIVSKSSSFRKGVVRVLYSWLLYGFSSCFSFVEGARVPSLLLRSLVAWALLEPLLVEITGLPSPVFCVLLVEPSSFLVLLALLGLFELLELPSLLELGLLGLAGLSPPVCCVLLE
jgi:hypothetical protein